MHYNTRHITRLRYSQPIRETVMVAHLQPRNTPTQHCLEFKLQSVPKTISECYLDALGNWVHHLSIGNEHNQVVLVAEGLVEVTPRAPLPTQLAAESWSDLAVLATEIGLLGILSTEYLHPTHRVTYTLYSRTTAHPTGRPTHHRFGGKSHHPL
jgi:transglutaminase-like putative cysteine protease